MKKIWNYLKHHVQEDFNLGHYCVIASFLAITLYINFTFHFKQNYLNPQTGWFKVLCYFLLYSTAYFFSIVSYSFFYKQYSFYKKKDFWVKTIFVLFLLSFDTSLPYLRTYIDQVFAEELQLWVYKIGNNISSVFTVLLPLLIFYLIKDRSSKHIYGLQLKQFDTKPYVTMLVLMMPLIIMASFHSSFLNQYPMCPVTDAHVYLGVPVWVTSMLYEIGYGLDFISVEFLFRGFMVIGMIAFLGRSAILSMAVVYCFLHFGKPAGEAVSSIFGRYLLGVIAYETKSIWGGIIVHLGIAWMMEAVAFIQNMVRSGY